MSDLRAAAKLAALLWSENEADELESEFSEAIAAGETQIFLKYEGGNPVGFAQCGLRHDYVEGTDSSPVGYLEGIFVKKECRGRGYAAELLTECKKWAKSMGCAEFASDCELDNEVSILFHKAVGFTEANRIVCFTKEL